MAIPTGGGGGGGEFEVSGYHTEPLSVNDILSNQNGSACFVTATITLQSGATAHLGPSTGGPIGPIDSVSTANNESGSQEDSNLVGIVPPSETVAVSDAGNGDVGVVNVTIVALGQSDAPDQWDSEGSISHVT